MPETGSMRSYKTFGSAIWKNQVFGVLITANHGCAPGGKLIHLKFKNQSGE